MGSVSRIWRKALVSPGGNGTMPSRQICQWQKRKGCMWCCNEGGQSNSGEVCWFCLRPVNIATKWMIVHRSSVHIESERIAEPKLARAFQQERQLVRQQWCVITYVWNTVWIPQKIILASTSTRKVTCLKPSRALTLVEKSISKMTDERRRKLFKREHVVRSVVQRPM